MAILLNPVKGHPVVCANPICITSTACEDTCFYHIARDGSGRGQHMFLVFLLQSSVGVSVACSDKAPHNKLVNCSEVAEHSLFN